MVALLGGATLFRARAFLLGERLDTRALAGASPLALAPAVVAVGERGAAALFKYGAVVLFHVAPEEEPAVLAELSRAAGDPIAKPECEEVDIRVAPRPASTGDSRADGVTDAVDGATIVIADLTIERLQLIGEILARNVALARYERVVRESFLLNEQWAKGLEKTGASREVARQLQRQLGATLLIQHAMAGRIEIGDKPDLLWDRPALERFYARLEDEYELKDRDKTLERKLALIMATAELVLDLVKHKQSNRLEWYIIGLIVIELLLSLVMSAVR